MPGQRLAGLGAFLHEKLDESTDFGRAFPGQGALAACQPDDDIAYPARFAGFHHQVLAFVVALVQQADRGDAVLDRCAELALHRRYADGRGGDGLGHFGRDRLGLIVVAALAAGERGERHEDERPTHRDQASGDQAW